ncbi:hypothetical protein AB0D04_25860 [Streptomyces sp. NPDC048483]|uniref:hypothetical protein n=1 Tax=Streptomyces sp. NPDC048483 TaxID=3154927 RepID=UPI0034272D4C
MNSPGAEPLFVIARRKRGFTVSDPHGRKLARPESRERRRSRLPSCDVILPDGRTPRARSSVPSLQFAASGRSP